MADLAPPAPPDDPDQTAPHRVLGPVSRYRVRIFYTEPSYAAYRGLDNPVYQVTYWVHAADPAGAEVLALERFRAAIAEESVGWPRQISRVESAIDDSDRGAGAAGA